MTNTELNERLNKIIDEQNDVKFLNKKIKELEEKIEKQQKEIEELKNNELDYTTIYINGVYEGKKYYKDKIRAKIKEIDGQGTFDAKIVLEHLLEEN